jgi:hypothetical protein
MERGKYKNTEGEKKGWLLVCRPKTWGFFTMNENAHFQNYFFLQILMNGRLE